MGGSTLRQAERVLDILVNLPCGRGDAGSTAEALADRYGVTTRTIYRHFQAIECAGIAVANRGHGYYLLPTEQRIPTSLSAGDLSCLGYAAEWLARTLPGMLPADVASAVGRVARLSGTLDARKAALDGDDGIAVSPRLTDGPVGLRNLAVAVEARHRQRKLRGRYRSPDRDEVTDRVLHPYAVVLRGDAHYLVAFCELRGAERTFRLDRFSDLTVSDQTCDLPDDYDVEHHFSGAWQVTGGRRRSVRVVLRGQTARRMRSQRCHPTQETLRDSGDELELQFSVAVTDELRSWLLGLGPDAEVISPKSLRRQLASAAERMSANYRQP